MRILITGNMGYVGPLVVEQLRRSHSQARLEGFDNGYFSPCLVSSRALPERFLDCQHFGDVRSFPADLLKGLDAIVYLAAISNDPMGNAYEEVTLDINYRSCVRLAAQAKAAGVRSFVFASSCSVYGFASDGARHEGSSLDPLTAYARSKVAAEQELHPLAGPGFKVTCLRFATACGMSDRLRLDLVVNDFAASAVAAGKITILSDGTPWRPLIHVRDMARAIDWAIEREPQPGGDYLVVNTGSDEWNYQVKTLAQTVAELAPGVDVSINTAAQPDRRSYRVDFSRFKSLAPRHQPQYDLRRAIAELLAGLKDMGFADADFRKSNWIRLNQLSSLRNAGLLTEDLRWPGPS
jgi:nucleoside-diphosphate-sugar epimerase